MDIPLCLPLRPLATREMTKVSKPEAVTDAKAISGGMLESVELWEMPSTVKTGDIEYSNDD
jgi:hypothetical protein